MNAIMLWLKGKIVWVFVIVSSVLLAAVLTMGFLYKDKSEQYDKQVEKVGTLTTEKKTLSLQIESLNAQIEDERKRHNELEMKQKQTYDEFVERQSKLAAEQKDQKKKAEAKSKPEVYQIEVQKALEDYQNRMNCITGNTLACTKI